LRITFGGGGSDLQPGGVCLAAAIDKYVTVTVADNFDSTYELHYSQAERVHTISDIRHRILRAVLTELDVPPGIQISTSADIPAGTGLGSSGAFTVALIKALRPELSRPELTTLACRLDLGMQDQWSAVWGGVNVYDFGSGTIEPVYAPDCFRLYYTGVRHDSAEVLTGTAVPRTVAHKQVLTAAYALSAGGISRIGECLTAQWAAKLIRQPTEIHRQIDRLILAGVEQGAHGGKLVGAGDGGFLLFATDRALDLGLREVPFRFDHEGVRCM
jgi:D-glycero-alpha-D-manno-heptose-7-phosphate kinase